MTAPSRIGLGMKHILITGVNRGIGLALVEQLLSRHAGDETTRLIGVCRQRSEALQALTSKHQHRLHIEDGMELTDEASLTRLADALKNRPLDMVVHNAGVLRRSSLESLDVDAIRLQFEVNALAPLRLMAKLHHHLRDGAKVGFVTSRMGSIADNSSGGSYGYRMSKAALNAAGVSLARDLQGRGIAVALLHPGFVRTDMTGKQGNVDVHEAASGLLARMEALSLETTGRFWHANGEQLPW